MLAHNLSEKQIEAVNTIDDDVEIIACAGAGKTGVVTRRIINILKCKPDITPNNIVAFTFTKKAAEELKNRVYSMGKNVLGDTKGFAEMYIGTIHGFCLNMLQEHPSEFQTFTVLDDIHTKLFDERYYEEICMKDLNLQKYIETDLFIKIMSLLTDSGLGERELLKLIYDHFVSRYRLGTVKVENQKMLSMNGYNFSHEIDSKVIQGEFRSGESIANATSSQKISVKTKINTHSHGIQLMHSVDEIKKITTIPAKRVRNILQRLFRKGKKKSMKLLGLDTSDFYAFIINNIHQLKEEFREIMATQSKQLTFAENAKTVDFKIPETELYKYTEVKQIKSMTKNVYEGYTNEFLPSEARKSTSERLFERFCENADSVEWIYKNGDSGQQYLSIVYVNSISKQWLFYPDYIIKTADRNIWIIETKGGMQAGHTKNIDRKVENKFNAFKAYAEKYSLHWGFVRDIDEELYINNTVYSKDMSGDNWIPLETLI